ncbi:MAG TPA: PepSY domain-containing protein [Steroidobacteraceae bacterium]|nr:PepSY domain-containing protein [Steroidobacteraceae bacterium]
MQPSLLSRSLHKWLALFVGLQLLVWAVTGFFMVAVDLDFIHGDSLVRNLRTPLANAKTALPVSELTSRYPEITAFSMHALPTLSTPVYELTAAGRRVLVDAATGRQLSPLSAGLIRELARSYYAGSGQLSSATLLEHEVPMEVRGRAPPLWRVDFDDWLQTTLYLHPDTGALVTRRHRVWRWYDFQWMLHIMDYSEREGPTGVVSRVATVLGVITVLSGVWLLYFSFWRPRAARRKT